MYVKRAVEILIKTLTVLKGRQVVLEILDTAGTEQFSEYRTISENMKSKY